MRRRYTPDPEWREDVLGQDVEIRLSRDSGNFSAHVAGEYFSAPTYAELRKQLHKAVQKARTRVEVPVTIVNRWDDPEPVTLTGFHARGHLLGRDSKGAPIQLQRFRGEILRRLTPEEVQKYVELRQAKDDAEEAFRNYDESLQVDGAELVKAAAAAKIDTPEEPPEEDADPRTVPKRKRA